mgnify:CR=1 FL=1
MTKRRPWPLQSCESFLCALALALLAFFVPSSVEAYPSFARHVGRDCGYCHTAFPKLNDTGRTYLANGYRFEAEGEWKDIKDLQSIPVSFEVEVEGLYDNIRTAGVWSEASDLKVEEAEVIAGGAFGREGRVSALLSVAVQQANNGDFDTVISKAFVQVNDLFGPSGAGRLNLRAGIDEVGLPFFRPTSTPISNAMTAETLIKAVAADQRIIELNGSVTSEGSRTIAHRYRAGIAREPVESDNKLTGFYASWAATMDEYLSFGAIYRAGQESIAGQDDSYQRYGVAAEAEAGPFIFTAGYFKSQRDFAVDGDDLLLEALYFVKKYTLGARFETAGFEGSESLRSQTYMLRYDILSNAYAQFEYRHREDSDRVAGGGELEDKARLILTALF